MTKQYIVLPAYGFRAGRLTQAASLRLTIPLAAVAGGQAAAANSAVDIGSVSASDPKLVEMTPETELGLEDELCKGYRHGARCSWRRDFPRPHKYLLPGTVICRDVSVSWLTLSRLPRPLLFATAFGWILMAGSDAVPVMPALCLSGPFGQALVTRTAATLAGGDVIGIAVSWIAMLVAMMAPLLSAPLTHVYRQSLSHRRWRAIGLFLLGYAAVWIAAGGALIPIAVTIQASVYNFAFAPAILGCVIALIWQGTPVKQLCLNACHRLPPLAAGGLRTDADDVLFGLSHARWCVGTCWALMLCTIMFRGPLHWAVMFAITLFLMFERSRAPRRPRWLAALVPTTSIFTGQTLFSRGAP